MKICAKINKSVVMGKYNTSRNGKKTIRGMKSMTINGINKNIINKKIKSTSVSAVAPKVADSSSLHNYTLSPGWTRDEVNVLKIALMKFGIGKWTKI
jgi:hypothetical protein